MRMNRIRNEHIRGTAQLGWLGEKARKAGLNSGMCGGEMQGMHDRWKWMIRCGDP